MRCSCSIEPNIRQGRPVKEGEKALWVQIFTCTNPQCENYKKDIGERKVNIFDETDIEEKSYLNLPEEES